MSRPSLNAGRRLVIGVPFVWLMLFFLLPFAIVLKISFSEADVAIPPYTDIFAYADLGASNLSAFWKITVPLSKNGIIAGCMLVFIPVVGEFVIPELLGGPETLMIGKVLWQEFFNNRDWPVASALAVVMLVILLVPIILFNRNQTKELEGKL